MTDSERWIGVECIDPITQDRIRAGEIDEDADESCRLVCEVVGDFGRTLYRSERELCDAQEWQEPT